jgi:hypothetical protein
MVASSFLTLSYVSELKLNVQIPKKGFYVTTEAHPFLLLSVIRDRGESAFLISGEHL